MNEIGEKYLPIGTVVMLSGGSKRVMIAGFCAMSEDAGDKMYDYSGCLYPEGFISSTQTCLFDHDQIEKVYFKGFEDDEEIEFKKKLNVLVKQISEQGLDNNIPDSSTENVEQNVTQAQDNVTNYQETDDDFLNNFPGPIEDAIKAVQEPQQTDDLDIIDVDDSTDSETNESTTINF